MSTLTFPISNAGEDGAFLFSATLDGVDYQLSFQFNTRSGFWYFDLLDIDGNPIRTGIKCVVNFPVVRLCKELDRPAGEIILLNTTHDNDPGLADLGGETVFAYEEFASLP